MEKTFEFDSRAALVAQAKLRLSMVVGGSAVGFTIGSFAGVVTPWTVLVGACHFVYAVVTYLVMRRARSRPAEPFLIATAVLDAFMVFAWAMVMDKYGIIFTPLFNFATIGYGMRTGSRKILLISQGASFVFVCLVPIISPYWQEHWIAWASAIIAVVIVPWYAGGLTRQFQAAIQFAEQESRAKTELMARVSHELRTPLGGISNAAELIAAEASTERTRGLAKTIRDLGAHLLADINDLIDQSRFTLARMVLDLETKTINSQIEVVRASVENRAKAKGLMMQCTVDPRLKQPVLVDSRWLSRVLINLAGNAVKFTDVGSIVVNVVLLTEGDDEYVARFSVHDTGIGISKDDQEKIFNPFVQVHGDANSGEGSGLGLAISKQAVELMGGVLRVNSTPGGGSQFWFDLRLQKAEQQQPAGETSRDARRAPGQSPSDIVASDTEKGRAVPRPLRVLLVDDNATNLFLLKELILREGHTVVTASSGEVAMAILSSNETFDLLILDYNLGDMSGADLLKIYRFGRSSPAPAWFLTADATLITEQKLSDAGALGVLTKPISAEELRRALGRAAHGQGDSPTLDKSGNAATARPGSGSAAKPGAGSHLRPVSVVYIDQGVVSNLRAIGRTQHFLEGMLKRAKSDMARAVDDICDALKKGSMEEVRTAAHALKGVSNEVGAVRLASLAQAIMRANDDSLEDAWQRIANDLRESAHNTFAAIDETVSQEETRTASGL